MSEKTRETAILDQNSGLREHIAALPEFVAWRSALPMVEVDTEKFYVVGGDQLKDCDQVIVEWVRQFRPEFLERGSNL